MIVSIGLGDEGVNVCLDDGIESYDPLRTVEMCNEARKLFAAAFTDTLTLVLVDDTETETETDE